MKSSERSQYKQPNYEQLIECTPDTKSFMEILHSENRKL